MKKLVLGLLVLGGLLFLPSSSQAATTIEELEATIAQLRAQIAILSGQQNQTNQVSTDGTVEVRSLSSTISQNLGLGDKEQKLTANFVVKVTAKEGDLYLHSGGSFFSEFIHSGGKWMPSCERKEEALTKLSSVNNPNQPGAIYYKLEKGKSANFRVTFSCPVAKMFPGTYYGSLKWLTYYSTFDSIGDTGKNLSLGGVKTRNVYVVGEKAPWIESATTLAKPGAMVAITGERLAGARVALKGASYDPLNIKRALDGKSITFTVDSRETPGVYEVYAWNLVGESNKKPVTIGAREITASAKITEFSATSVEGNNSAVTLSWRASGITDAMIGYNCPIGSNLSFYLKENNSINSNVLPCDGKGVLVSYQNQSSNQIGLQAKDNTQPVAVSFTLNLTKEDVIVDSRTVSFTFPASSPVVAGTNNASLVSMTSVPATLTSGQILPVTVVMKNTGTKTWVRTADATNGIYKLGIYPSTLYANWGFTRAGLPVDKVAPGESATFTFNIKASSTPGTYPLQFSMVEEGKGWFGARTVIKSMIVKSLTALKGDLNKDGKIDALDLDKINKCLLNSALCPAAGTADFKLYDLNSDGRINSVDLQAESYLVSGAVSSSDDSIDQMASALMSLKSIIDSLVR